jgi:hypothetical protein
MKKNKNISNIIFLGISFFLILFFYNYFLIIENMDESDNEKDRKYVSSRGILKSCTFHSNIPPKSSNNNDVNYLNYMISSNNMFDGMSIYVCSDTLSYFVNNILPKINNTFTLVSGDSDLTIPNQALNKDEQNNLFKNKFLINWYAQNCDNPNNKLKNLPIGLDYHTLKENPQHKLLLKDEDNSIKSQENVLININNNSKPFYERKIKIYVNYSIENDKFNQRKNSLEIVPENLIKQNKNFTPRTENWNLMSEYAFVLSPYGMGMDCHRTWEALCLGCIPIVCAPSFKEMFNDLPLLNVEKWDDINETVLLNTINKFKDKNFNYDKLTLKYWTNKINI